MIVNQVVLVAWGWVQEEQTTAKPWFASNEVLGASIGAVLAAILTFLITRRATSNSINAQNALLTAQLNDARNQLAQREARLAEATARVTDLAAVESHYNQVRTRLGQSTVVHEYHQPVLLLGPRNVGKTSLLAQWHAPWDHSPLVATSAHKQSSVPVYDFAKPDAVPHFADPKVKTAVNVHLKLRVHDFPGELTAQASAIETAREETADLRERTAKNLGVVLVCMFDASEAATGLKDETIRYYNGELFARIRHLVSYRDVDVQRLVVVFNKFDKLELAKPGESPGALLALCVDAFGKTLQPLYGACNPERVCETATILSRENPLRSQGSSIVFGEVARGIVESLSGQQAADRLMGGHRATTFMSRNL